MANIMRNFKKVAGHRHHLEDVLSTLHPDDANEMFMLYGPEFRDLLLTHFEKATEVFALVNDKHGFTYIIGGVQDGQVWMLASEWTKNFSKRERRNCILMLRAHLDAMLRKHGQLYNFVHKDTKSHIELLIKLGAEFDEGDHEWLRFVFNPTEQEDVQWGW